MNRMRGNENKAETQKISRKPEIEKSKTKQEIARAGALEADHIAEILSSRKNAWRVAASACVFGLAGLGLAAFVTYRYSQPIASQLLRVNEETGFVEPVQLATARASYSDAIDKGNLARYVRAREGYNYYQQQLAYDITRVMSSASVFSPYNAKFVGSDGLAERWGDSRIIRVNITSIMLHSNSTAVVRYTTQLHNLARPIPEPTRHHIATISYEYPDRVLKVSDRYLNPLGFLVTSWDSQIEMGNS